jgi:MinD superfamily P-loop ATPase
VGVVEGGLTVDRIQFAHGVLNVGEPMAVPVITRLKQWHNRQQSEVVIRDAPPGTSCPVVESLRGADFVILVTEPTPFGLHDLGLAVELTEDLNIPVGVIVNRDGIGDSRVDEFCDQNNLPILLRIPFDRRVGEGIARGKTLVEIRPDYREGLIQVYAHIQQTVAVSEAPL